MPKRFIFSTIIILAHLSIFAQETTKQYTEDFEQYLKIIEKCNPQYPFRKLETGYDIIAEIEKNRTLVDTCSSIESFSTIMYKCLLTNLDFHCYFPDNEFIENDLKHWIRKHNLDTEVLKKATTYARKINKPKFDIKLPIKYINGKYMLTEKIVVNNKTHPKGAIITSCNSQEIHNFVNNNLSNSIFAPQWDFEKHRYFNEYFYRLSPIFSPGELIISFESSKDDLYIDSATRIETDRENDFTFSRVVKLLNNNILYIKIPEMLDAEYYLKEIGSIEKNDFGGVIFDVRGNGGGNDEVWIELLSKTILSSFDYNYSVYFPNNKFYKKHFGIQAPKIKLDSLKEFSFLDFTSRNRINKSNNLIENKGKIVIIQDKYIFSGTANFVRAASYTDQIYTIGETSGYLLGNLPQPRSFWLSNTGLCFSLPIAIDLKGVENLKDVYHSTVDRKLETSLEYYSNFYVSRNIDEFIQNDIFIKEAIELINE